MYASHNVAMLINFLTFAAVVVWRWFMVIHDDIMTMTAAVEWHIIQ